MSSCVQLSFAAAADILIAVGVADAVAIACIAALG